jgi:hypothetical protein
MSSRNPPDCQDSVLSCPSNYRHPTVATTMQAIELHVRGKGWTPQSPSSHGDDNVSDSEFGKMQAADASDMRRMGKKQEFRVSLMTGEPDLHS